MLQQSSTSGGRPKKLGQLLVEHGWVDGSDVLHAIQSQRRLGGRIGTRLLELDVVSEEHLLEALAEQFGAPAADVEALRHIPDEVVGLLPSRVAERCMAVPFKSDDRDIDVATLSTRNLGALDELAHCTHRHVRPYVTTEVRIYEALGRYYNVECPRRYVSLIDRLNRARYLWEESAKIHLGLHGEVTVQWQDLDETFGTKIATSAGGGTFLREVQEPHPLEFYEPQYEEAVLAANDVRVAVRSKEMTLDDIDRKMGEQTSIGAIGDVLLEYVGQYMNRSALFKVRGDHMHGWLVSGERVNRTAFAAINLHFRQPSIFLNLLRGADYHLGPLPPMPMHKQIAQAWKEWPSECLMIPIRVRDRLVAVIYGDRSPHSLAGLRLDDFKALSTIASMAFELCILRKKMRRP